MNNAIQAGPNLSPKRWQELKMAAIFRCGKWDVNYGGYEVLARFPLLVNEATVEELRLLSEQLTCEALRAERDLLARPHLLWHLAVPDSISGWLARAAEKPPVRHVRVMRFDFHYTTEGWRISEVNADVPGGYVEASGWNLLLAEEYERCRAPGNPARAYARAVADTMEANAPVALMHATVYSEDRQVMACIARELEDCGKRAILSGKENILWKHDVAYARLAAEEPLGAIVRLTPAEWLLSRRQPEEGMQWFGTSRTPLSNPGSALLLQSKRFPLVWDELPTDLSMWRRLLPTSSCPSQTPQLDAEDIVLKPALGRLGQDVAMRGVGSEKDYREILCNVRKRERHWVAQKRFVTIPVETEDGAVYPCIGVYTVNGKMAGLYGRAAKSPLIDERAQDVAVLVTEAAHKVAA